MGQRRWRTSFPSHRKIVPAYLRPVGGRTRKRPAAATRKRVADPSSAKCGCRCRKPAPCRRGYNWRWGGPPHPMLSRRRLGNYFLGLRVDEPHSAVPELFLNLAMRVVGSGCNILSQNLNAHIAGVDSAAAGRTAKNQPKTGGNFPARLAPHANMEANHRNFVSQFVRFLKPNAGESR